MKGMHSYHEGRFLLLLRHLVGLSCFLLFAAWPQPAPGQEQKLSLYLEEGKSGTVWDIVFSRDETRIISCGRDSTVKVWNALTGAAERTFRARMPTLMTCIALSPGGNIVAAGDMSGMVTLWEWKTGLTIQTIKVSSMYVTDIEFTHNGRLVTASRDDSIRVWTARDFRFAKGWPAAMIWINKIALSPDARNVVAAGADGSVTMWTLDGSDARKIVKHGRAASAVAFSPDGLFLFSGARDGIISVYELSRGSEKTRFALDRGFASDFGWTSNPEEVAVAAQGEVVTVYDWYRGSRVRGLTPSSQGAMRIIASRDRKRIYTAQIDGGVHVFDYSTGLELATMVGFSDGQWICFTPDGFFESSQFGSRYAQWKQEQEFFPFDLYEKIFHKPGIVEDALQGKYTAREALTRVVHPPEVKLLAPRNGQLFVFGAESLQVVTEVEARDAQAVSSIELFLNGRRLSREQIINSRVLVSSPTRRQVRYIVPVLPGENVLEAVAYNAARVRSDPVTIQFNVESDAAPQPDLYVVSVGVNSYGGQFPDLKFPEKDAREIGEVFRDQEHGMYRRVRVTTLMGDSAAKTNILSALRGLSGIRPGDVLILFFSGHGLRYRTGRGDVEYYFGASGVTPESLPEKGLSWKSIAGAIRHIQVGRVILLLDACHSGDMPLAATNEKIATSIASDIGIVFSSSSGAEYSFEKEELGNGIFTKALLEGLRGKADYTQDRLVDWNEMQLYVTSRVQELSDNMQHPMIPRLEQFSNFNLVRIP